MRVLVTGQAEKDLEEIGDFIAAGNPARAVTFVEQIRVRCSKLASTARSFAILDRYRTEGIRRVGWGRYLIFFRVQNTVVEILRVVHGARDYEKLLLEPEKRAKPPEHSGSGAKRRTRRIGASAKTR